MSYINGSDFSFHGVVDSMKVSGPVSHLVRFYRANAANPLCAPLGASLCALL